MSTSIVTTAPQVEPLGDRRIAHAVSAVARFRERMANLPSRSSSEESPAPVACFASADVARIDFAIGAMRRFRERSGR